MIMHRARTRLPGPASRAGFTLIETIVVLMLIGMITSVLISGATSLFNTAREQDPETAILSLFQKVRGQAVESGQVVELQPLPEDAGFVYGADGVEMLPKREGYTVRLISPELISASLIGGQLEEKPLMKVRFYPDGSCDPLRIQIRRGETRRVYPIDPWTAAPLPQGGTTS